MATRKTTRRGVVSLDGRTLTVDQVVEVADGANCRLAPAARKAIRASRRAVERTIRSGGTVYGINTGFGQLAEVAIASGDLAELQKNLVRSHCAGTGEPFDARTVRAILALRANCLARGHSGARLQTVEQVVAMLNAGVYPIIPSRGSVGASGDLAPLAHMALAVIGEGEVEYRGRKCSARAALRRAGLTPLELEAKEGLALINGTQVMTAVGCLALARAERLATMADLTGAMSLEALLGSHRPLDPRVHESRPHPGQMSSALNIRRLVENSAISRSHAACGRVQDAYSLRCMPQVHGAVRDALAHIRWVLGVEINASTDNPMVFADDSEMVMAGNFHGQTVALAMDHLATAVCSLANISERRIDRLMNSRLSQGLPAFLAREPGLNSGFMLAHVTAAALVSENKVLAHPASVDSITTSASQEDHVSMGVQAALQAAQVIEHVATVLGIEMMCAAQALDLRRPLVGGAGVEAARRAFRRRVRRLKGDRVLSGDIATARELVVAGQGADPVRTAVEAEIGPLL